MMNSNLEVKGYEFNTDTLDSINPKYINWPVVYLINNNNEIYIGETSNIKSRMKQHLDNPDRKYLELINIIFDKQFNKSAILDIEQNLIRMFYADTRFNSDNGILNKNNGQSSKHNYYQREMYLNKLVNIWEKLKKKKLVNKSYNNIINSDIYKYSPFISLTNEQEDIMCKIINNILDCLEGKSTNETSIITGLAGTGKTILAINLIYNIINADFCNIDTFKEDGEVENLLEFDKTMHRLRKYILYNGKIKIGFVVPMQSLRETLNVVFKSINSKNLKNIVIGPGDVTKDSYDVIICDEAHRLAQYKNIQNMGYFKKICKELQIDENTSTQLDWISIKSKYKILFYDGNQTIRGSDISAEKMNELIQRNSDKCYSLTTQLRCKSGELFLDNIDKLFKCTLKDKIESSKDFEIKVFNDPNEMIEKIKQLDKEMGLCRNVAGNDWEWKSERKSNEEIRKNDLYDFDFEGKKYIWNRIKKGWILSNNAVNEIGCVHTVQGYDLNYVGVIIGPDLSYNKEKNKIEVHIDKLKDLNVKKGTDEETVKNYIINTYKILLERGIKGCYIYACDESMHRYLEEHIENYNSNKEETKQVILKN